MTTDTQKIIEIIDRKWNRLIITDNKQFYRYFRRLWEFLRENPLTNEILLKITNERDLPIVKQLGGNSVSEFDAENIMKGHWTYYDKSVGGEERDIAAFIKMMDKLISTKVRENLNDIRTWSDDMYDMAIFYIDPQNKDKYSCIHHFFSLFLLPILEYVKDDLNSNMMLVSILHKFKQKSEWFEKRIMFDEYKQSTQNGEKILKKYFYKYLFEQGVPFFIEPKSPEGEVDFLIEQSGNERIGGEAKVYNGNNKSGLVHGIETQFLSYLRTHNLSVGYYIIFKVVQKELHLSFNLEQKVNYIDIDNKRIYIIVIDIYCYEKPPSTRNKKKNEKEKPEAKPEILSLEDFS